MTLTRGSLDEVADELEAAYDPALASSYRPRWNIAPTDTHVVMLQSEGRRRLEPATWGFSRGRGSPGRGRAGSLLINARSETAPFRDAFREAFVLRRCVVPADGFYEWSGGGAGHDRASGQVPEGGEERTDRDAGERRPHWIHRVDGKLLLLAGLWDEDAHAPYARAAVTAGRPRRRFVVLTTAPNAVVGRLHDRMPVVLSPARAAAWLAEPSQGLLEPAPDDWLAVRRVSRRVNSVRNDDAGCLAPAEETEAAPGGRQLSLFRA
jgi:putative SOS response-associated peptidase YedK